MKPDVYCNGWKAFENEVLELNKPTIISVDNLVYNPSCVNILCLIEPRCISSHLYTDIDCMSVYDKIYTFDPDVLRRHEQAELFLYGTTWLDFTSLNTEKKNQISFVTSSKNWTEGHLVRQQIYDLLSQSNQIGEFSVFAHRSPPHYNPRNDFFASAKFHVAVENVAQDNYFTEKLVDCLMSYTVPIYRGCLNIGNFFNPDGFITFDTVQELQHILSTITADTYDRMQEAVRENRELAAKYAEGTPEDNLSKRLASLITAHVNG